MKTLSGVTYLSPKEVAEITPYSVDSIRKACRKGELQARQPGGKYGNWAIPSTAIEPWLNRQNFYGGDAA